MTVKNARQATPSIRHMSNASSDEPEALIGRRTGTGRDQWHDAMIVRRRLRLPREECWNRREPGTC
jgi:hypothetical protein